MGKTKKKDWTKLASNDRRFYQYERPHGVKKRNLKERFDGKYDDDVIF